ncbi:MAG: hypothetical protein NTW29_05345 [Bacteroidetes bacterium]|nr:hypothetical protein [Bacteroidota bacterium]
MRKIFTICLASIFFVFTVASLNVGCGYKNENKTETEFEEEEEESRYDGMDKAIELEIEKTKDPATGKVPWAKWREAMEQTAAAKRDAIANRVEALAWLERGPNGDFARQSGNPRQNDDQTAGRIRATMVDSLDPTRKTVFAGSVAGGLWKTTDITASPANWTLVNDFLSNLAIADICQDPRPGFQNIMYMCTGESYFNADAVRGIGVFKSIDAGSTWNFLPSSSAFLNGTRILCDHLGNVYVGTRGQGLQRSTDGGNTWTNITPTGIGADVCDLEISTTGAAGRLHVTTGIFSTSGYRYTDIPTTVTSAAGWSTATTPFTTFNQRTELGIAGNTLYACPDNASHQVPTIWKSTDGGDNWASTGTQPGGGGWANGQGWYDLSVGINPANPNVVIVGGRDCFRSNDGGATWAGLSFWVGPSALQYVHADQHDIQWWDGGNKILFACDGGIHFTSDGGTTIRDRNKGLRIKQFYSVAIHPTVTNWLMGGAQDNGMHRLNHPGLDSSIEFYGGDGMFCAFDQDEPQFQFGSAFNNNIRRSVNGGVSWGNVSFAGGRFVSPWDYDNTGNRIYLCNAGGNYIRWDNPQTGTTSSTVTVTDFGGLQVSAVHVSPYTANRVFFGTSNGSTSRLVRLDNAETAAPTSTIITPAGSAGFLNCVVTGSNDNNLIACFSNFGVNNVFRSTDGGTTWTACDGNLPDMPVRWALFHPDTDTKAYIATATGVWETDLLNGASTVWAANPSFPNVSTDMIKYRASDRTIAAGTHGRGIWTATIPLPGGFTFSSPAPATAACPAPATMDIVLGTVPASGFTNPITLTNSAPPAGTTVSYIPGNIVTPGNNVTVRLNGTNTLAAGSYVITITGTATGATTQTRDLTFTITPGSGPAITGQPANSTICEGNNTSFSITSPTAATFQWQLSTDGGVTYTNVPAAAPYSGTTTATLSITAATLSLNNNRYRCIASTQCGSTTSSAGILTVNPATAITVQPVNASSCTGASAQFCVTAVGAGLGYQWQVSPTGCAGAFTNVAGATSNCLTLTGLTLGQNGSAYRCVVTGTCAPASITSSCVTLSVATSLSITGQPVDATICEGSNASFTVAAAGAGTYQWQISTDGGATYNNVPAAAPYSGTTSATLNITGATAALSGNRYRCQLASTCGNATSNGAILTVNTLPAITSSPVNATVCTGNNQTFSVTATGTGISYQWQVSTDGGATYNNVPAAAPYSGTNTPTLTITGVTIGLNNNRYRCVVTGTCPPPATSGAAILTVLTSVTITSNPANQTICEATNTSFTVGASGSGLTYQWQVSTDGGTTYTNLSASGIYSGVTSATLVLTNVPPSLNNNRYRCVVSNASCTPGISTGAILTVNTFPIIGTQPQSITICENGSATFSVAATTGVGSLSYQWQVSTDGGTTYTNIAGATTNSFAQTNIPVTQNGYRFRVIVTAGCGSVTSAVAILTVNALPVVTFTLPYVICLSDPALSLSATPSGGAFSGPGVSAGLFNPSLAGLGQKTILYTATNAGCVTAVSRTITVNECGERHLSLEQFPAVVIYPSPNNGRFSIRLNTDLYSVLGMKVYNGLGQMVRSQSFSGLGYGSIIPVDLGNVPSGTYHLFLYNDERGGKVAKKGASIVVYKE